MLKTLSANSFNWSLPLPTSSEVTASLGTLVWAFSMTSCIPGLLPAMVVGTAGAFMGVRAIRDLPIGLIVAGLCGLTSGFCHVHTSSNYAVLPAPNNLISVYKAAPLTMSKMNVAAIDINKNFQPIIIPDFKIPTFPTTHKIKRHPVAHRNVACAHR